MKTSGQQPDLCGSRVLVWGLGRFGGGVGVTRWLVSQGAKVTVIDRASPDSLRESCASLAGLDVELRLGGENPDDLRNTDLVIVNPAVVKWKSGYFAEVLRRDLPWTTEINLFCAHCPAQVVGVTGSYGKSTTSAMLFAVADRACQEGVSNFQRAHLGGNIGRSLLTELPHISQNDVVILELSNAQLEDLPRINWAPNFAVITNIHPHHLDRYRQPDDYYRAKANIARDPWHCAPLVTGPLEARADQLVEETLGAHPERRVKVTGATPPVELIVPGAHNQANAACVLTIANLLKIPEQTARAALKDFRGLPHRLEIVRLLQEVTYVNDSKSTAPSATVQALQSFERPIVLIVGGQKKEEPWDDLSNVARTRCRAVVATGEAASDLATRLGAVQVCTMGDAVGAARKLAQPGDIVLLSPGAPSFDAYHNYEERGRDFARCVHAMSP